MKKAIIQLETLACPSCMQKIEGALKRVAGVNGDSINVSFNSSRVRLDFADEEVAIADIENAITTLGYDVVKSSVR